MHKRDIQKSKRFVPTILRIGLHLRSPLNGHLINDSNKIADAFNEYFSNIGPKLADNIDFNEGNRSYHEYLSGQNTNTTFQLKETNSLTVSVLFIQTK